jgi:hypothetical protein
MVRNMWRFWYQRSGDDAGSDQRIPQLGLDRVRAFLNAET